ncbi:MAG: hypothetical protein N3A69_10270 [Leptospiraceae bacterium]|nr:hypothetical protein [Leptospiraceae bacterium]
MLWAFVFEYIINASNSLAKGMQFEFYAKIMCNILKRITQL